MKFNKFNPGKKITIFFIFFAITFFLLGLWQVERGHDKSKIIEKSSKVTKPIKPIIALVNFTSIFLM